MVAGGGASGGQKRALVKELERSWDVPQGNKGLCFSVLTGFCLLIKGEEVLNSPLGF